MFAPVAQLDRVRGYEPRDRGFESLQAYQDRAVIHPNVCSVLFYCPDAGLGRMIILDGEANNAYNYKIVYCSYP